MPNVMGSDDGAPSAQRLSATPRVLHVIPTALGRGAQVFARALVDELGGPECGHRLVSLFDGPNEIAVDGALGLAGGPTSGEGLHPAAVTSLIGRLRRLDYDLLVAHGGDAFKYLALAGSRAPSSTWSSGPACRSATRGRAAVLDRVGVPVLGWPPPSPTMSPRIAGPCCRCARSAVTVIPNGRDDHVFVPAARTMDGPSGCCSWAI